MSCSGWFGKLTLCPPQAYDQKNIRRRVYDALNVLMAMNIISKEKKEIKWIGLPTNSAQECQNLEVRSSPVSHRAPVGSPWSRCMERAFLLCVRACLLRVWSCVCLAWTGGQLLPLAPCLPTRRWCATHSTCLRSVGPGEEASGPAVGSKPQRREV